MKQWYQIKAQKNRKAEIHIYEEIGENWFGEGLTAKKFIKEVNDLDVDVIDLFINSPGGSVFDGNAIYNILKRHRAEINVTIDGIAASICSVIAMAGDTISMPENAMMMIHDPSGVAWGTAKDMNKMADTLEKVKIGILAAYMTRAAVDEEDVAEMMSDETWMTAQDAVDFGFADTITDAVEVDACFDGLKNFAKVPESLFDNALPRAGKINLINKNNPSPLATNKPREEKPMDITLEFIQSKHPDIVAAILKTVDLDFVRAECPDVVATLIKEGAAQERDRILAVREQTMPGHEKQIEDLMFDGETTGEQAAVAMVQAEKNIRAKAQQNHTDDSPPVLKQPKTDDFENAGDEHFPLEDRCKARWDKSAELRDEFSNDYEAYVAFEKAVASGKVRVLNK